VLAGHSEPIDKALGLEQERLADFRAVQFLINPIEFQEVATLQNKRILGIAVELRGTTKVIEVWQGALRQKANR
jgi:hypothetical protein